jgi:hypothetical protein
MAVIRGRAHAFPQDVYDVAYDILNHRVILGYEALADGVTVDDVLVELLSRIPAPSIGRPEDAVPGGPAQPPQAEPVEVADVVATAEPDGVGTRSTEAVADANGDTAGTAVALAEAEALAEPAVGAETPPEPGGEQPPSWWSGDDDETVEQPAE